MNHIETDYLVVGAGASGMALVDTLLSETNHTFVLVDRRHQPGGHWVDAYPFVQLHQPSAYYGVNSLSLGEDRIDTSGVNAGFYERAGAAEINHYYQRVLREIFLPSERVQFFGGHDYLGAEGDDYVIRSNISQKTTRFKVRRALVDATVMQSSVPATHKRPFAVAPGVRMVTPNRLVDVADATGFTILGGGKTAMDVCFWLLQQGLDQSDIRWVRPRDSWLSMRQYAQPLSLAGNMMKMQAASMRSAAEATSIMDYYKRMEAAGISVRIDPTADAVIQRGAQISQPELDALRSIENVVHGAYVRSIDSTAMNFRDRSVPSSPGCVYVDCTARGLNDTRPGTIFEDGQINLYFTTLGVAPWSAAVVGFVESLDLPREEKNRLCPALPRTGEISGVMETMRIGMPAEMARRGLGEFAEWSARSRLNPGRAIPEHMEDPEVKAAFGTVMQHYQAAGQNIERLAAH